MSELSRALVGPVVSLASVLIPMPGKVDTFDFIVNPGQIWIILGPKGSGKTSLFKIIAGLIQAPKGQVTVLGTDLNDATPQELIRMRSQIGVLFENDGLIPTWTVFECLALYWRYHDIPIVGSLDAHIEGLLIQYGLMDDNLLHATVATLTAHQRHRVSMIRALQKSPRLLLLDNLGIIGEISSFLSHGFMTQLQKEACSMILLGGAGVLSQLDSKRVQFALVMEGSVRYAGSRNALLELGNHEVDKLLKEYKYG